MTIDTGSASVLADISLPAGWVWADATIKITADLNSAYIVYVGEDKDNYIETTCLINIQQTTDKKPSQEGSTASKTLLQKQFYIIFSVTITLVFVTIAVVLIVKKRKR